MRSIDLGQEHFAPKRRQGIGLAVLLFRHHSDQALLLNRRESPIERPGAGADGSLARLLHFPHDAIAVERLDQRPEDVVPRFGERQELEDLVSQPVAPSLHRRPLHRMSLCRLPIYLRRVARLSRGNPKREVRRWSGDLSRA